MFTGTVFKDIHTCAPTKINRRANANFFAEEYQEKLLKHPTWKLKLFVRDVEETYGVKISRCKLLVQKKNALSSCAKVVGKQYDSLRDYMYELRRSNQGTSVFLVLKPHVSRPIPQFHMFYVSFLALRKGFLNGCRRVLGLDSVFLKGYCKDDLEMEAGNEWTLLSDKQKGLLPAIAKLLPDAEHRLCARHIFTNWTKVVKGAPLHKLFWKAVKSYTEEGFNDAMNELRQRSSKALLEMCSRDVKRFCRRFYKSWACTGIMQCNLWGLDRNEEF
ncbi:uncharacterized protein LOC141627934 [Silene latifolia]|uniref:uncharacterized protein LOC141627934 n=1 Tax=Silene latifolia TaxID=37657 RepID=UPI003D76A67E